MQTRFRRHRKTPLSKSNIYKREAQQGWTSHNTSQPSSDQGTGALLSPHPEDAELGLATGFQVTRNQADPQRGWRCV